MCGRRKMEREYPQLCDWGDMPFEMVEKVAEEINRIDAVGQVIQFHNNGEPLLYPRLGEALTLFASLGRIRQFNTNGKLLMEKAKEIIGNLDVLTVSVVENDPEGDEQYEMVKKFIEIKGSNAPKLVYRLLGRIDHPERWEKLPGLIARRTIHSPDGSFDYQEEPVVPEIGICLDLLTHLSVDRYGNASMCVRFDPDGYLIIGNVASESLLKMWHGTKRRIYISYHKLKDRDTMAGCQRCEYWGIPRGSA